MDDLQRFKETYITECFELLEDMEERLLGLDQDNPNNEELNAIFRCAHSIKGGSGAFGFNRITSFTHILEELLDAMREGDLAPTREVTDALLSSVDIVRQMVVAAQSGVEAEAGIEDEVSEHLRSVLGSESNVCEQKSESDKSDDDEISIFSIEFKPKEDMLISGNEPLLIINELKSLGDLQCEINTDNLPDINKLNPEKCYVSWSFSLETEKTIDDIREVFEFVEDECELIIEKIAGFAKERPKAIENGSKQAEVQKELPKPQLVKENNTDDAAKAAPVVTSIRVDIDKVDRLVNMVGELVITQAMIAAQSADISFEEHPKLVQGITTLSQHTRELQEAVMAVRMQPVKSVFSRMPRIVRDLSTQLKKDIRLEMIGEATELDRTVIEQLSDPLTHMIRNSVDHGIDTPENRIAAGKPAQGVIKLSAEHAGGKILLKISDDGRGVNRERVLQKAKDKGLVSSEAELSDHEIDNLIFMPGFSTAEVVSNISGRGVGMDVVKRNIESLGGTINIINKPGEGSTFLVSLPLTLAILDGMIVRVGREKYIIPIGSIIETMRPKNDEVRKIADANDLINVRGDFISILYLHKVFRIAGAEKNPSKALVVLVENGMDKFGLVVDELIGQQQVVIKSLEENSDAVPGISAATILGDGKVALILDISKLQELTSVVEEVEQENVA
ncbi:MAG: chemotaxis protein CheA [Rickettsiales bacterium]|nr:chemotaxis protein CheA [Pseudomonadota bacterium]MDA0965485.1 chemotaxis protein CheA [Pseudomonadota bacterium]MDG4542809.1 chemotaxis protein CheA [Rickettsiales bacterium]MDG4544743.1 chemotaxis protein CheA [Rickettsiales bacterium]MDG4546865.1 chemotaxis protein CheA [Rickettsiales bacterium]